jgi:hypothetical protein
LSERDGQIFFIISGIAPEERLGTPGALTSLYFGFNFHSASPFAQTCIPAGRQELILGCFESAKTNIT